MCQLCSDWVKTLTVKEKLAALNEVTILGTESEEHLDEVHRKLLKEYAEEISKEVMAKPYEQLTFQDFVMNWESDET
jgi:hypothetical protein